MGNWGWGQAGSPSSGYSFPPGGLRAVLNFLGLSPQVWGRSVSGAHNFVSEAGAWCRAWGTCARWPAWLPGAHSLALQRFAGQLFSGATHSFIRSRMMGMGPEATPP